MESIYEIFLEYGIIGAVVLFQILVIRKLYRDAKDAKDEIIREKDRQEIRYRAALEKIHENMDRMERVLDKIFSWLISRSDK